jgi:hypothetical protein
MSSILICITPLAIKVTVAEIFTTPYINISWPRDLIGDKLTTWNDLVSRIANIVLSQEQEEFFWNIHHSGSSS